MWARIHMRVCVRVFSLHACILFSRDLKFKHHFTRPGGAETLNTQRGQQLMSVSAIALLRLLPALSATCDAHQFMSLGHQCRRSACLCAC